MITEASMEDPKEEDNNMYNKARVKLEKNLASPDKAKREMAMSLLCLWLTSQKETEEEGLSKIWKGMFYCLYHAEEETTQVELAERMACLMENLDEELSLLFFKAFLTTLRIEWGGMDKNSLERFHLLLRKYISHMFVVLKKSGWDREVVRKFMNAVAERVLLVQDGVDVNVYFVSVFLHELRSYLPIPAGVFKVLLEPFWVALSKGCDERVAEEISRKVFLVLFEHGSWLLTSNQGLQESDNAEEACFGNVALNLSFLIRTKSSALLAFTSESKSAHLKLIEEKFTFLESRLAQSRIACGVTNGDDANVASAETETQSNADAANSIAESTDRLQTSVSPAEFPVTKPFGRRSKRNQKLVLSPHVLEKAYANPTVTKVDTPLEDVSVQIAKELIAKTERLSEGESTVSDKTHIVLAASEPELNPETGEVMDVEGGSPPDQEFTISEEDDRSNILAANDDGITMEDPVISNLAKRFESIADQSPCCEADVSSAMSTPLAPSPINTGGRKRKSWKSLPVNGLDSESPTSAKENNVVSQDPFQEHDIASIDTISAKKAKKVHFALQHNIVWKPSTPLPPHDVRVPPAATPRGSALKKGVPPGPIVDPINTPLVSPNKKKSTSRKSPAAQFRSPKSLKNSAKVIKLTKRGRLSPR